MKYIKYFESAADDLSNLEKIEKEIESYFYIVEDEGINITTHIYRPSAGHGSWAGEARLLLRVSFINDKKKKEQEGNYRRMLMNNDGVQEFIDRISDICNKYSCKIHIDKNPNGHWSYNYIDVIKSSSSPATEFELQSGYRY